MYRIQQNLSLQTFMFCTLMMLILRFMKHETTDRREAQKEELENSKKILRKSETEQIDGFTTNCHGHDLFLAKKI